MLYFSSINYHITTYTVCDKNPSKYKPGQSSKIRGYAKLNKLLKCFRIYNIFGRMKSQVVFSFFIKQNFRVDQGNLLEKLFGFSYSKIFEVFF